MLVALALLTMTISALPWILPRLSKESRFEKSVQLLQSHLAFAQELMIDYDTDVHVFLKPSNGSIACQIRPVKQVGVALCKRLETPVQLPGISHVSHDHLLFDRHGRQKGLTLTLQGKKKVEIALKGYPARIVKGFHEEKIFQCPYPKEMLAPS
jgi:hypothetical protein